MEEEKVSPIKLYSEEDENLKKFVRSYWFLKKKGRKKAKIFPMVCPHILIHVEDSCIFKLKNTQTIGEGKQIHHPMDELCEIDYGETTFIIGIELTPQGYYYLSSRSSDKVLDKIEEVKKAHRGLDEFLLENIDEIKEEKLDSLKGYLTEVFQKFYNSDEIDLIDGILTKIDRGEKIVSIVEGIELNIRTIERKFKKVTGLTLKKYQLIVRLNRLLDNIYREKEIDWSNLALEHGFFDQAHMIKTLKKYLGISPTSYLKVRDLIGEIFDVD